MIAKPHQISNPFGPDWLDKLKQVLPTIERLDISEDRIIIDGNREALFILGDRNSDRTRTSMGVTKIYLEDSFLKVNTTVFTMHLWIGVIVPLLFIAFFWSSDMPARYSAVGSVLLGISPIFYLWAIVRQKRFSEKVAREIELLNPGVLR